MKRILFYIEQEYYWTSLKPVYDEFAKDDNIDLSIMIGSNSKRFLCVFLISQQKRIEKEFIEKGFQEALDAFGGWLPDISYDTLDSVMAKLDEWAENEGSS